MINARPPELKEATPMRAHQQALFRLHKRWRTLPVGSSASDVWLHEAVGLAVTVPPTPQLLPALVLLSKLVWAFYMPKRQEGAYKAANSAFWHHVNQRAWLRKTEMGALMTHLPCR